MFEAMVRAVTERRSDRLDEISTENVKLDAQWRKATTDKTRAEAEREAMEDAVTEQAKTVVDLLGMVGRYTVVLGDASRSLRTALEDGRDGLDGTVRAVAASLRTLVEQNDEDFQSLVGHTVASYAAIPHPSTLEVFKGFTRPKRLSSAPTELQSRIKASRSSATYGTLGVGTPRKSHLKSPRKSLRNSHGGAGLPYRRPSDKGKEKKVVQWRDEAGQGDLDEAREASILMYSESSQPSISIIPAPDDSSVFAAPARNSATESEWEDEKTDESVHLSFSLPPHNPQQTYSGATTRTRRGSRLDSGFLKSRGAASTLGRLNEDDENGESTTTGRRALSDRSLNSFALDEPSVSSNSSSSGGGGGFGGGVQRPPLVPSKASVDRRKLNSPALRPHPTTPRSAAAGLKVSRRRSNIGPMRMEKARRRSSLRPPTHADDESAFLGESASAPVTGMRRAADANPGVGGRNLKSPAKKKRMSLLSLASKGMGYSSRPRPGVRASLANVSTADISSSADMSSRMAKPTWK
jgi:kinesin family protein 18/19